MTVMVSSKTANPMPISKAPSHYLYAPVQPLTPHPLPLTTISLLHPPQIVGGPNARTDYHINSTPEFFYQYRGSMLLRIVDPTLPTQPSPSADKLSRFRDIPIREGELFLLPPNTPHNPIRFADTVGVVLEQPRPADSVDTLRWYCQECREVVHEASFHCTDLGSQIRDAVNAFVGDEGRRRCRHCGALCDTVPRGVVRPE